MKALALRLQTDQESTHPMHAFITEHPEYGPTQLLQWNPKASDVNSFLFYIDGPREPFLSTLDDAETANVVEPSSGTLTDGFYLYIQERLAGNHRSLVEAFTGEEVIVVPPVIYGVDRSIRITVVGVAETLQRTIDQTPDSIDVSVRHIWSGASRAVHHRQGLTARQHEVVGAAIKAGYYAEPRKATIADVADHLDCAASTTAEHLRKAESTLMRREFDSRIDETE